MVAAHRGLPNPIDEVSGGQGLIGIDGQACLGDKWAPGDKGTLPLLYPYVPAAVEVTGLRQTGQIEITLHLFP